MAQFDWIPYFQGKYLTYYQWFALLGSTGALVISLLFFFMYLLLSKISNHRQRYGFLGGSDSENGAVEKIKNACFNLGFCFLSLIPLFCSAMDVIYLVEGMVGMFAVLIAMVFLDNGRRNWDKKSDHYEHIGPSILQRFVRKSLGLDHASKKKIKKVIFFSILMPILMYQSCICFYNPEIGFYSWSTGFGLNTYVTRLFQLKRACPPGAPCQIYATIPENPEEAFFLNLHTHEDVSDVTVFYQELFTQDPTAFRNVTAETYDYPALEWKSRRRVHSALIMDLKPNTKYLLKVHYDNQFWTNAIYKTLPSDPSTPIRMINAGDSGYTNAAINLSKIATTLKPDIFFMGGDVAYDDNMPACAYTWDYFLGMYGRMTATIGYLVPLALCIGNHDVGLNEIPHINITVDNNGPAYFIYFPQHYDRNLDGHIVKQVPPIQRRRGFLNFTFSNVHYVSLDTGYMNSFDGKQKKFMIESFEANKDKVKFVNYHVPIYSVCEKFDKDPERFLYALFHWVPNFDKYKVMAAFQNHVHSFKRTKPLVGSTPTENGTVYLGDGAYGAIVQEFCKPDVTLDIFAKWKKNANNMWITEIGRDTVKHVAYDSLGIIIDQFQQDISAYVSVERKYEAKD